ncbi:uncharacterized protein LOC135501026 [Lineus longissimus]|uniref:uncharacterized protein LOC135501026 n=1 Tax=Lineus longissimus TaxID=88925 RepID=UPI00315D3989
MAVEAQRLIAVSLGKIASARGRRTGVDLHKNLLVSTVLQRAKNVFIIETYRATVQAKTEAAKAEKLSQQQAVSKQQESVVNSRPLESMDTKNNAQSESDVQSQLKSKDQDLTCSENKENDPAVANENKKENTPMECNEKLQENKADCDRTRPSCDVLEPKKLNRQTDYSTSCGGCVNKRRHTEIEEESNSSKRAKYDNSSSALVTKNPQESNTQISTLVNIFNSGFSGLVNVAQSGHHNKGQGYSSDNPATNSCATAVANGFTKLAGPIIAMAMTV